jgi:fumarate reductase subunit D
LLRDALSEKAVDPCSVDTLPGCPGFTIQLLIRVLVHVVTVTFFFLELQKLQFQLHHVYVYVRAWVCYETVGLAAVVRTVVVRMYWDFYGTRS